MAKVIRQNLVNTVFQKALGLWGMLLLVGVGAMGAGALLWRGFGPLWGLVALLFGAGAVYLLHRKILVTEAGARGEREALLLLKRLPAGYCILPDRVLRAKGRESQVDYLILAPGRAILVECKNLSGVLRGGKSERQLRQIKYRDGKIQEEKSLYNPMLQVEGHRRTLLALLGEAGLSVPVETAVYFTNPNCRLELTGGGGNLFLVGEGEALLAFLQKKGPSAQREDWQKRLIHNLHKKK